MVAVIQRQTGRGSGRGDVRKKIDKRRWREEKVGIGWSLWYSDKQVGGLGETERAWGDREKVRRDEKSDCGVDVDVMVAMILQQNKEEEGCCVEV